MNDIKTVIADVIKDVITILDKAYDEACSVYEGQVTSGSLKSQCLKQIGKFGALAQSIGCGKIDCDYWADIAICVLSVADDYLANVETERNPYARQCFYDIDKKIEEIWG